VAREYTSIRFAGLHAVAVKYSNARGFGPSTSWIEVDVADFPEAFHLVPLEHGGAGRPAAAAAPGTTVAGGDLLEAQPGRVPSIGTLELREVVDDGTFEVAAGPLYVLRLEEVLRSEGPSPRPSRIRVVLVDSRYFGGRGVMLRWSFNRLHADGSVALDSVSPAGKHMTLAEIAGAAVGYLPGKPKLARAPADWAQDTSPREWPRLSPATLVISDILKAKGAEPPCLNLDGSFSFYAPGEGREGYAPGGEGGANVAPFPKRFLLSKELTGQAHAIESGFPPDYVLVVGGRRVRSFRTEDWEPVLYFDDAYWPLFEGLVELTAGQWDLETLARWVLVDQAGLGGGSTTTLKGVSDEKLELLHDQAWRLWRLKGVVVRQLQVDAPGPDAHMAPLLACAETVAGRRVPVKIECYRWVFRHVELDQGAAEGRRLNEINSALDDLKRIAQTANSKVAAFDPNAGPPISKQWDWQVNEVLPQARLVEAMRDRSPEVASKYEQLLLERYALEAEVGKGHPGRDLSFKRAQVAVRQAKARENGQADADAEARLADIAREEKRRSNNLETRAGTGTRSTNARKAKADASTYMKNIGPVVDDGARVHSDQACVVRTRHRSGWLSKDGQAAPGRTLGIAMAAGATFVPKPPRVTFGAHVRPRVDRPPAAPGRVATSAAGAGGSVALQDPPGDFDTYYTALFKRVGAGVTQIPLDSAVLDQAISVDRDDLVELVRLTGESNREQLDAAAFTDAAALVAKPTRIQGAKITVAHCWPALCDGLVASVEITSDPDGCGFETVLEVGSDAAPLPQKGGWKTTERPKLRPRQDPPDGAKREGLA
jgi:hypothetical protein